MTEPVDGERLVHGCVYVAPADRHMKFSDECARLDREREPKQGHSRPSVDALFLSAAAAYSRRVVAIVLTGNGHDGAQGCLAVSDRGGISIGGEAKRIIDDNARCTPSQSITSKEN